ncbi:MAG TPA: c-type cytochrome biogenesis protein CcmI [Stellaceae bacterium]|nr:c-type cytochrome biogenesis protein CcmI [Stellaceae bacterium]
MLLAVALAVMTIVVVATVVLPLMRAARAAPERAAFDRAVYRDQLRELERDVTRGLVENDQAATARLEIERRLLAAGAPSAPPPSPTTGSPVLAVALALLVPAVAAVLYLALGAPGVPDQPYAERGPERSLEASHGHVDLEKTAAELAQKLKNEPGSVEDWLLLARTEAALGHWQKSADAYRRTLDLSKGRPDVAASYGEMLVMAADGIVTPSARDAFLAALARDPRNMAARYYIALGQAQAGEASAAIEGWQKLAAEQSADSPLRAELQQRIADAAKTAGLPVPQPAAPAAPSGPSAADRAKAAEMTPEQREQMIRGMVEGLAAKLKANPGDLEGWLKLGRAYGVLGESDKAVDAYEHAQSLKPDDPEILIGEAQALMGDRSPETPIPDRAVALLKRVELIEPDHPAALWYLGLASAQQKKFTDATDYWQRLLDQLPAGSQHDAVSAAIAALQKK